MTIRLATPADAPALLDLTLRAYQPIRELNIAFAAATADLELVQYNIREHLCFVLEEEGRLLSTITLRMPWGVQPGPLGLPHIWWFATDPDVGRSGVGSRLITWCEESMVRDTLKAPAVSLGTADRHPWLVDMYKRRGYEVVLTRDSGKGYQSVVMKKVVRPDFPGQGGPLPGRRGH